MLITRQNYEEYALDYIEGTLGEDIREEFERFLALNPDLAEGVSALFDQMPVVLPDSALRFEDKSLLKRRMSRRPLYLRIGATAAILAGGLLILDRMEREIDPVVAVNPVSVNQKVQVVVPEKDCLTDCRLPENKSAEMEASVTDGAPETVVPVPEKQGMVFPAGHPSESNRQQYAGLNEPVRAEKMTDPGLERLQQPNLAAEAPVKRERIETVAAQVELRDKPEAGGAVAFQKEEAPLLGYSSPTRVVIISEEYIIEDARTARDYFAEESPDTNLGLLNLFNRKGLKRITAGILTPLSSLNPVSVHETHEERVVEVASITVSRRAVQKEERSN